MWWLFFSGQTICCRYYILWNITVVGDVLFFISCSSRALSFVTDVENMLLCCHVYVFSLFCFAFIQAMLHTLLQNWHRVRVRLYDVFRVRKINVQKTTLFSSNRHFYSPLWCVNVSFLYAVFCVIFLLRRAVICCCRVLFSLFSRWLLLFVVIENMFCEFYDFSNAANNNRIRFYVGRWCSTFRTKWMNIASAHIHSLSSTHLFICAAFGHCYFTTITVHNECFMSLFDFTIAHVCVCRRRVVVVFTAYRKR